MTKTVTFLPAQYAMAVPADVPMIAIGSPGSMYFYNHEHTHRLDLKFHDNKWEGPETFNWDQANTVVRFLNALPEGTEHVVVHCGQGESRSAAVAQFMIDQLDYVLKADVPGCKKSLKSMNTDVYERLCMAHYRQETPA